MKSFARSTWKWNLTLTGSVKSAEESATANAAVAPCAPSALNSASFRRRECELNFIQTRYAPPPGTWFFTPPPLPPAWARGEGNFRCISIFLAYCKNAIMADLPPGHAKDDCSLSQNRLWAGLMRPACNWITTPQSASAFPCLSLKLHHAIWLTSERRANTSRFPVNIDNANCPFFGQIARGSEGCHSA